MPVELSALRLQPPELGRSRAARVGENQGVQGSTRHWVAIEVHGNYELLTFWPDAADEELKPVDAAIRAESSTWTVPWSQENHARFDESADLWELSVTGDPLGGDSEEWAVYNHVDLTTAQEEEVALGERDVLAQFEQQRKEVEPIVAQIGRQTERFFDVDLPLKFKNLIEDKRKVLTNRAAVTASLKFPNHWAVPAPKLDTTAAPVPVTGSDSEAGTDKEAGVGPSENISIGARARLAPASFDDVQAVIRVWADAIERTPAAFHELEEDRVSDLLAATLNATLPGAKREVYTREGKSDIFIQADTLAEGRGPAKIFICETKWADDAPVVQGAVDPQLFGYLTVHDTAAVLLLLLRTKSFAGPKESRLTALRGLPGYVDSKPGPSGWPIYKYSFDNRSVDLCVATVHVPPKREKKPKTARTKGGSQQT